MSPASDTQGRLAAVREHPRFAELLRRRPSAAGTGCGYLFSAVVALVFAGLALFFLTVRPEGSFGMVWIAMSLLFAVVGLAGAVWALWRFGRLASSSLERLPALVVDKRHHVRRSGTSSGAGGMSSSSMSSTSTTSTTYYVTLEFEDGARRELRARGRLYGLLGAGDAGVAYVKDRHLLDYERLDAG